MASLFSIEQNTVFAHFKFLKILGGINPDERNWQCRVVFVCISLNEYFHHNTVYTTVHIQWVLKHRNTSRAHVLSPQGKFFSSNWNRFWSSLVSCYRLKFDLAVKWNRSNVVTPKISASGNFPLLWGTETRTACPPYGTALHLQPDTVSQANTTNQNEHLSTAKGEWRVLRKFIVFFAIFCPTVVKPFKHQQYFPIVCTNRKQT